MLWFNKNEAKTIANVMDKVFKQPSFYEDLCQLSNDNYDNMLENMGNILIYFIASRDKNTDYSVGELLRLYQELMNSFEVTDMIKNRKDKNIPDNIMVINNVIKNGFMTHSFNGYFYDFIKDNGLGIHNNNDEAVESLKRLESYLGISRYVNENVDENSYFISSPGVNSFNYACTFSPERLFLGPFKQEKDSALPIIVGETEEEYMMRLAKRKIDMNVSGDKRSDAMEEASKVVGYFCTKDPVISLIPINDKLKVSLSTTKDQLADPLPKRMEEYSINSIDQFIASNAGGNYNNLDDLVCRDSFISSKELGFFETMSKFKLLQLIAKHKGLNNGDLIDYYTGEKYIKLEEIKEEPMRFQLEESSGEQIVQEISENYDKKI